MRPAVITVSQRTIERMADKRAAAGAGTSIFQAAISGAMQDAPPGGRASRYPTNTFPGSALVVSDGCFRLADNGDDHVAGVEQALCDTLGVIEGDCLNELVAGLNVIRAVAFLHQP